MHSLIYPEFVLAIADNCDLSTTQISRNFNISEFFYSETANRLGISNSLAASNGIDILRNIVYLTHYVLQPLRDFAGAIRITSGYRCKTLNEAVDGVINSYHLYGRAADIVPVYNTLDFCHRWLEDRGIKHVVYKTFIHVQI